MKISWVRRLDVARRVGGIRRGVVAVGQRAEESDHVIDVAFAQRRRVARVAVVRHFALVDVARQQQRHVVELVHDAVRVARVPFFGIRVALHVELDRLAQRVEIAVVEDHLTRGDVAQGRHLELAAEVAALREVDAIGTAQAHVEIVRVGIRRNIGIARHAEVVVGVVGEHRRRAVVLPRRRMAARAAALGLTVERGETAQLLRRQHDLALQEQVELRAEGMEFRIGVLVGGQRIARSEKREIDVLEDVLAEQRTERVRIARVTQLVDDARRIAVRHFVRGEKRPLGLRDEIVGASVAIEAAGRRAVVLEEERHVEIQVAQRRHGAKARHVEIGAARLHRLGIGLRVRVRGVVARAARHLARRRQRRVVEDLLPECSGRRVRCLGRLGLHRKCTQRPTADDQCRCAYVDACAANGVRGIANRDAELHEYPQQ